MKCVRNDTLIITYDLTGLTVDPKSGKVKFSTKLELINDKGASIFDKTDNYDPVLQLGGGKMPSLAHITPGAAQAAGKYTARITITDLLDKNEKNGKTFNYPFEILGDKLGFIQVAGPAFGVPGLNYVAEFGLANLTLDKKNLPKAEVNIRVLDEKGVAVDTAKYSLPADLPDNLDLAKANVIPFRHGVYPNRPRPIHARNQRGGQAGPRQRHQQDPAQLSIRHRQHQHHHRQVSESIHERAPRTDRPVSQDGRRRSRQRARAFSSRPALLEDGQYEEAVKSFRRTLELSPQFSKVFQLLGTCLIKLNRQCRGDRRLARRVRRRRSSAATTSRAKRWSKLLVAARRSRRRRRRKPASRRQERRRDGFPLPAARLHGGLQRPPTRQAADERRRRAKKFTTRSAPNAGTIGSAISASRSSTKCGSI